ncbi:MAG: hypothetical protein DRO18_02660 [Thermoprotei archaeon]|nr:MAG: hypothetical protein DRO18_02660 [Thermoprotei archaeon]
MMLKVSKEILLRFLVASSSVILAIAFNKLFPGTFSFILSIAVIVLAFIYLFILPSLRKYFGPSEPDLDFIFLLAHMLSLSTGKPPHTDLIKAVSDVGLYRNYGRYFKRIYALSKEYGYNLPDACILISKRVREKYLKEFLERLASVISVGEDVERFLETEFRNNLNMYEYIYGRIIDSLRILLGSYAAVFASAIFILMNFMILSFFFGGDISLLQVAFIAVFVGMSSLVYLIYKVLPKDILVNCEGVNVKYFKILRVTLPAMVVSALALTIFVILTKSEILSGHLIYAAIGLLLFPAGFLAKRVEAFIYDVDRDFPIFTRMYGSHLSIIPSLLNALEPLLKTELGRLSKVMKILHVRLLNRISPDISFRLFSLETGSELVRKGTRILYDSMVYGADMVKAGNYISEVSTMLMRTRRLRHQVFKAFESSVIMLHVAAIVLVAFSANLLNLFAQFLAKIPTIIPFTYFGPEIMSVLTVVMIIFFSVINSLALTIANKGLKHTFIYYLSILFIVSGLTMYIAQQIINYLTGSVFVSATEVLSELPTY